MSGLSTAAKYAIRRRSSPANRPGGRDYQRPTNRRPTNRPSNENARRRVEQRQGYSFREIDYDWAFQVLSLTFRSLSPLQRAYQIWRIMNWLSQWRRERPNWWNSAGWQVCGSCASPGFRLWTGASYQDNGITSPTLCNSATACLSGQGILGKKPFPSPVAPNDTFLRRYDGYLSGGGERGIVIMAWNRPANANNPIVPHSQPDWRNYPDKWPSHWPNIRGRTPTVPAVWPPLPGPPGRPDVPPETPPMPKPPSDTRVEYPGLPGSKPEVVTVPAVRQPPRPNEREKKFKGSSQTVQSIFRRLSRTKEAVSEMDDFIDTIFEALPKRVQEELKGRKTPQGKLQHIYKNWNKINWTEWLKNFVENWLEDKVMGYAIKKSDQASKARGDVATIKGRGAWMPRFR